MKNIPLLVITLVGTLILVIGVAAVFSSQSGQGQTVDVGQVRGEARLKKGGGDQPKVSVVEFSDFQCPACKASQPLVKQLMAKYPDQVEVVYRHYPLVNIHPYATLAAQAAEAAHDQNKFWEMHDLLFERQEVWSQLKSESDVQVEFEKYAEELAIDKAKFVETIQSETVKQNVAKDVAGGNQFNIQATPTFYVNGKKVPAPQQLLSIVESELTSTTESK